MVVLKDNLSTREVVAEDAAQTLCSPQHRIMLGCFPQTSIFLSFYHTAHYEKFRKSII